MSKKKQETPETEKKLPDAAKALRERYDQFWKQTAEQWDEVARSPQFLSMMAANLNQSLELRARVQEMVVGVLRTLNIPTRDDLTALMSRLLYATLYDTLATIDFSLPLFSSLDSHR